MRYVFCFALSVLSAVVLGPASVGADLSAKLDPRWSAVFPPNRARALLKQCSRRVPGGSRGSAAATFAPTREELTELEGKLGSLLADRLRVNEALDPEKFRHKAADYYRQYSALIVNGRRIIYANGFHRSLVDIGWARDWHHDPVIICDGGSSAFGVEYDPLTKVFAILSSTA